MSKTAVIRRLGPPSGPPTTGRDVFKDAKVISAIDSLSHATLDREYWLYENTPVGHDTRLVVDHGGSVASIEIVPHADNATGNPRTVVSKPGRRRPMADLWNTDPLAILSDKDSTARALAEFSETVSIEFMELGLTDDQKSLSMDTSVLDEALDGSEQPEWMLTPIAIRRIGHHLHAHGGFSTMQRAALLASRKTEFHSVVSIVDRLWDGIGTWRK